MKPMTLPFVRLILGLLALAFSSAWLALGQNTTAPAWQRLPLQTIGDRAFRQYATVSRTDGTYRQMFIDEAALRAYRAGQPLPDKTFIVMETYYGPNQESTNFSKELKGNGFQYGSFSPGRPSLSTRTDITCSACHGGAKDERGTFTLPMLEAAARQGQVMTTRCDQGGRSPCGPEVYERFTPAR